jgi:carboxyl-terminal processing protease
MRRYRPLPAVLFAILVSALVGGLFGRSALATDDKVPEHYRAFTAALNAIETSYIDKVDSDNLVYGAVRGMLGTLDPHSSFFSPKEYAQMRERRKGATTASACRFRRSTATSRRCRCSNSRRRTRKASAAAT